MPQTLASQGSNPQHPTREEVARDHITRTDFRADMAQLMDRFDRLERKLDRLAMVGKDDGK
jgi:hypothetical protein